jgi:hypothetical protein
MKRKGTVTIPKNVVKYLEVHAVRPQPVQSAPRVRLGQSLDWRYFAKRVPSRREEIYRKRKDQKALRELHARLVSSGVIRA